MTGRNNQHEKVSSTPKPLLNPTFLTPPPTVENPITSPEAQKALNSICKLFG